MKLLAGALAALFVLAVSPQPASAYSVNLIFRNTTKVCASVTVWHSSDNGKTWKDGTGDLQPRLVKAGETFAGSASGSDSIRVQARMSNSDDCTRVSGHIEAVYLGRVAVLIATLSGDSSRYYLRIK